MQIFSAEGKFLHHAAEGQWIHPVCISFHAEQAFIADWGGGCVTVCRLDGSLVRKIYSFHSRDGISDLHPFSIVVDRDGFIFVAQYAGRHRAES